MQLRTVVRVLAETLIEAGAIDHARLSARIVNALAALEPRPPTPSAVPTDGVGTPYRGGSVRPPPSPPPARVVCSTYEANVLAADTTVTEVGTLCDECFRKLQLQQLEQPEDD